MSDITCDDCGTVNTDFRDTCKLCGESLHEEKRWPFGAVLGLAVVATLVVCGLPGLLYETLFHLFAYDEWLSAFLGHVHLGFWLVYLPVWGAMLALAHTYDPHKPKEEMDPGYRTSKLEAKLWHMAFGYYLIPITWVRNLWAEVLERANVG